jgi:hypothetical protein
MEVISLQPCGKPGMYEIGAWTIVSSQNTILLSIILVQRNLPPANPKEINVKEWKFRYVMIA